MKKLITLSLTVFISVAASAQWDTLLTNTTTNFNSITFVDVNTGVAIGKNPVTGRGAASFTTNGGTSWAQSNNASNSASFNGIAFVSPYLGYIVADSGQVLTVIDGGDYMTFSAQLGSDNLNCISRASDTVYYIGGDNGVLYKSIDFGQTWAALNSGTSLRINDIYFANDNNGWIVGDGGFMAATADGGQTWTTVAEPYFGFFNCSGFAYAGSTPDAFAIGNSGDMIHSSNGGLNWNAFSSNTTYNLNSVRFTNDLAGIVAGDNGKILRTQDGGINWFDETMPSVTQNLTQISWASDTVAYICGSHGRVLKSRYDISAVHNLPQNRFEISAYPNPFADELNISIDLAQNSQVKISVTDVTGRIVLQENEGELHSGKQFIHPAGISSLVSGMYFVKVISGNGEMTIPVVKK